MSVKVTRERASDQSGVKIAQGKAVSVRIRFEAEKGERAKVFRADLTEKEAGDLIKLIGARAPKVRRSKRTEVEVDVLAELAAASGNGHGEGGDEDEAELDES